MTDNATPRRRAQRRLTTGSQVQVMLLKPGRANLDYPMRVLIDDGVHIVVQGRYAEPSARDLGFVRFEPGDVFTEHYWRDRWYSIKQVHSAGGMLKGWYCDVARPVRVSGAVVISEDLELDLWVSADGHTVLRLDEHEFGASGLTERDPAAAVQARRALDELERLAGERFRGC